MDELDSKQIIDLLTQLTDAVIGPPSSRSRAKAAPPLSDRIGSLETKVGSLETKVDARFKRVDTRFNGVDTQLKAVNERLDQVDHNIESARVEIVDLVTRVHDELTGRIVDLEPPRTGGGGGGRGSGSSGVPLAS